MTDETKPKRMRGQKEREAAYRAGFLDGLQHAMNELIEQRKLEEKRETKMGIGLEALRAAPPTVRRRRKKPSTEAPPDAV